MNRLTRTGISRSRSNPYRAAPRNRSSSSPSLTCTWSHGTTVPVSRTVWNAPSALPRTPCAGSRAAPPHQPTPPATPPHPEHRADAVRRECCRSPTDPRDGAGTTTAADANDTGNHSGRRPRPPPHDRPQRPPATRPRPATVGASNNARTEHLHTQHRPHPAHQTRRQKRMPTQIEETVIDTDPRHTQHLREQPTQDLLPRRPRTTPTTTVRVTTGAGRALRSTFPFAVNGTRPAPRTPTAPCNPARPRPHPRNTAPSAPHRASATT